jgi:hypothetical protein
MKVSWETILADYPDNRDCGEKQKSQRIWCRPFWSMGAAGLYPGPLLGWLVFFFTRFVGVAEGWGRFRLRVVFFLPGG